MSLSNFTWIAAVSRFCEIWIKTIIRNVTIVITSCHVSEKPNNRPEIAQRATVAGARANTHALPTLAEPALAANSLRKTANFSARAREFGVGEPFFFSEVIGTELI